MKINTYISTSVAQFIVFREKRKMAWREILREKMGHEKLTKKLREKRPKMTNKLSKVDQKWPIFYPN